jgi:hypothetical protein
MRKYALAFAALTAMLPAAAIAGDQDFTLVNKTGYQINEVYVAAASATNWGKDIMGQGVLANNGKKKVTFKSSTSDCEWQLRVKFADGDVVEWEEPVDLCSVSVITLKYNRSTGETSAVTE